MPRGIDTISGNTRPLSFFFLIAILLTIPALCGAQTDDDDENNCENWANSSLDFSSKESIQPSTQYEFSLEVINAAEPGSVRCNWIYQIEIMMPSKDYVIDPQSINSPQALHPDGDEGPIDWEHYLNGDENIIVWQTYYVNPRALIGDIREGESLAFTFIATTDADATDGFVWSLEGDLGDRVEGIAYFDNGMPENDDDDDTDDEDLTPEEDSNNSDDDDDGCGC